MTEESRRAVLRRLGLAGATGLAGCQGLFASDATDRPPTERAMPTETPTATETSTRTPTQSPTTTPSPTPAATIDLETRVEAGADSQRLVVSGNVSATRGIDTVTVRTGETTATVEANGAASRAIEAVLPVTGGRSYQVDVRVRDAGGVTFEERLETDHVPIFVDPIEPDRLVGAHYYPWYETRQHRNWTDRTVSTPMLGEYAATDRPVVDQHLKWSLEHGVNWWSVSWWGPDAPSNRAFRETVAAMENFADIRFSALYETVGRLEEFDYDLDETAARDRLASDLAYLERTYFTRDNYLRLDDRPVVFVYIANALDGDVAGAFAEATSQLDADPYILADVPFGTPPSTYAVTEVADAVTSYNPYSPRPDIESVFHDRYERGNEVMHLGAEAADVDYVPVVIPGFNDTGLPASVREDNPVLSASPERYERVCEQVRPHLADAEAVLVTSFNEWYENTQIEPGEEYGTAYLELTAERLATGISPGFDPDGAHLRLAFDETIVPAEVNPDSDDDRELAFMAGELAFRDGDREVATFDIGDPTDEPLFLKGVYGASSNDRYSWRWFGGPAAESVLFVEGDLSGVDNAVLTGQPMRSDEIEADVYFRGTKTDHVAFGDRDGELDDYELSLTDS
jgi:hypothetical protein